MARKRKPLHLETEEVDSTVVVSMPATLHRHEFKADDLLKLIRYVYKNVPEDAEVDFLYCGDDTPIGVELTWKTAKEKLE